MWEWGILTGGGDGGRERGREFIGWEGGGRTGTVRVL